jgi:four helix bundle protein
MSEDILNINRNINRGFRKLEVWQEAIALYVFVKEKVRGLKSVPFKIKAQVEDSIFSCHSNIAEGYCRRSLKENIQFNNIALSSLGENYSQLYALLLSQDIEMDWFNAFDRKHYSLENKLISYNKSQIQQMKNNSEWRDDYIIKEFIERYESKE